MGHLFLDTFYLGTKSTDLHAILENSSSILSTKFYNVINNKLIILNLVFYLFV
jgi:hypothetical protein